MKEVGIPESRFSHRIKAKSQCQQKVVVFFFVLPGTTIQRAQDRDRDRGRGMQLHLGDSLRCSHSRGRKVLGAPHWFPGELSACNLHNRCVLVTFSARLFCSFFVILFSCWLLKIVFSSSFSIFLRFCLNLRPPFGLRSNILTVGF